MTTPRHEVRGGNSPGVYTARRVHYGNSNMQGERMTTTNSDDIVNASSVHDLLRDAARHFWRNLGASSQAQAYLGARGIQPATARRYGLGFAQPAWRDLGEVLQRYDDATALASGLLVCGGGGVHAPKAHRFDRFRNRLLFPIRDLAGKVVGFGGRFLGDEGGPKGAHAKYLNSPESEVFRKRELLYGLYEAQQAILESGEAVVVEGYVDVLSAQQAGVRGAVGSLGTACTAAQLEALIALGAKRIVFCFDGDAAGRQAATRALATLLPLARDERAFAFVALPDGHDPDSLVREQGAQAMLAAVAAAKPLREMLLEQLAVGCDLRWAEGRVRFAARASDAWRALPAGDLRNWLEARVRDVMQTSAPWVREYLQGHGTRRSARDTGGEPEPEGEAQDRAPRCRARPLACRPWRAGAPAGGRAHAQAA